MVDFSPHAKISGEGSTGRSPPVLVWWGRGGGVNRDHVARTSLTQLSSIKLSFIPQRTIQLRPAREYRKLKTARLRITRRYKHTGKKETVLLEYVITAP